MDTPAENSPPPAAPAAAGLMPTLIVAVVVAVILGGIGFVLAYFVLPSQMAAAMVQAKPGDTTTPVTTEHPARSPAEVAAQGGKPVTRFTIEEITVNIAETRGSRYVRAGVYFEADGPVLEELEANRARIVDTLGQILSTKTLDDLTSPSIRGTLRQELLGIINPTLKSGRVDNVYFTDLLVQ